MNITSNLSNSNLTSRKISANTQAAVIEMPSTKGKLYTFSYFSETKRTGSKHLLQNGFRIKKRNHVSHSAESHCMQMNLSYLPVHLRWT